MSRWTRRLLVSGLVLLFAYLLPLFRSNMSTEERQVLPTNVKPLHYELTLKPDLETFVFHGKVKIE